MKTATQTSTETVQGIRKQMMALKSLSLMAVLSVFLLFAQAVEHSHSHDADLQAQFDCEICLKVGSLDDIAVAKAPSLISNLVRCLIRLSFKAISLPRPFALPRVLLRLTSNSI